MSSVLHTAHTHTIRFIVWELMSFERESEGEQTKDSAVVWTDFVRQSLIQKECCSMQQLDSKPCNKCKPIKIILLCVLHQPSSFFGWWLCCCCCCCLCPHYLLFHMLHYDGDCFECIFMFMHCDDEVDGCGHNENYSQLPLELPLLSLYAPMVHTFFWHKLIHIPPHIHLVYCICSLSHIPCPFLHIILVLVCVRAWILVRMDQSRENEARKGKFMLLKNVRDAREDDFVMA